VVADPVLSLDGVPVSAPVIVERSVVEWSCPLPAGATARLTIDGAPLEPFLRPGETVWRWRWQAPAVAGEYPLHLAIAGTDWHTEWRDVVRIAPSLLDARRYAALLSDLARMAPTMAHALRGGRQSAGGVAAGQPDQAALLALLTGPAIRRLLSAVERLAQQPHSRRLRLDGPRELGAWRDRLDPARWRMAVDAALMPGTDWPDRVWMVVDRPDLHDRGRVVTARLLDQLLNAAQWLLMLSLPERAREQLVVMMGRLRSAQAALAIADRALGPVAWTPRSRDERIVYAYRRLLQRRIGVGWDRELFTIPVRDVARLYEIWCAAQVALCLVSLADWYLYEQSILDEQVLRIEPYRPLFTLRRADGATLTLRYQPRYLPDGQPFRSLDDRARVPDLAIELITGQQLPILIAFDAKYRSEDGALPASALDEGYSYLAGIGRSDGSRAVNALALLFPGHGAPITYPSGLTAMPLLPGDQVDALRFWLQERVFKITRGA